MSDYGILSAIATKLKQNTYLGKDGSKAQVHLGCPTTNYFPMILLELEEIWTSPLWIQKEPKAKIRLKASVFSQNTGGGSPTTVEILRQPLVIADCVRHCLEQSRFTLDDGCYGVVRLCNSVIDVFGPNKPRGIYHMYEALVR